MLYWLKNFHLIVAPASDDFILIIDNNTKPFFHPVWIISDDVEILVQVP